MIKMTLAQGLNYRNRVIAAIQAVTATINKYNSVQVHAGVDNRKGIDINALLKKRAMLKGHLVDVKLKLHKASQDIREDIFTLSEIKDDIKFYQSLNVTDGMSTDYRAQIPVRHDAVINHVGAQEAIAFLQKKIDAKQADIESFNHKTTIEIEEVEL